MSDYRVDDFIEQRLERRENLALSLLAASCLVGIVVIWRI
jgi:hypothetical protein